MAIREKLFHANLPQKLKHGTHDNHPYIVLASGVFQFSLHIPMSNGRAFRLPFGVGQASCSGTIC
jgi:hypothetical protein